MRATNSSEKGIALVILVGILLTVSLMVTVLVPVLRISGMKTADDMRGLQEDLDTRNAALIALSYYSANRSTTDPIANKVLLNSLNEKKILGATVYVSPPVYVDISKLNDTSTLTSLGQITQIRGDTVWAYSPAAATGNVTSLTLRPAGGDTFSLPISTHGPSRRANFSFTSTDPRLHIGQEIARMTINGTSFDLTWVLSNPTALVPGAFIPVLGSYRIPFGPTPGKDYMYRRYNATKGVLEDAHNINHDTQMIEGKLMTYFGGGNLYLPVYEKERNVEPGTMIPVPTVVIQSTYGHLETFVNAEDEMNKPLRYLGSFGGIR